MPENICLRTGDGIFIRNTRDAERHNHASLHQNRSARLAKSAMDTVFLDCDDRATFASGFQHGIGVERFDCVH